MSQRIFITTTPLARLRPLSWQGMHAAACYGQFSRILKDRLGPAHLALFAEPFPDDRNLAADWHAWLPEETPQGPPVRLTDMPPDSRAQAREHMIELGRPVYELARELKQNPDTNTAAAGILLEMALTFPGEEYVYMFGSQPVLTAWGYAPDSPEAEPEHLTRLRLAAPSRENETDTSRMPGPTLQEENDFSANSGKASRVETFGAAGKHVFPWPFAAFLGGALAAALLLYIFTPETPFGGSGGRAAPYGNSTANAPSELKQNFLRAQGEEEVLRAELERLRREYHYRLAQCGKPDQEATGTPPSGPAQETGKPVQEQEAVPPVPELALPEIPSPPPAPPKPKEDAAPVPKPEPSPAPKPKNEHLEIPDNPKNLAFLEGCWEAEIPQGAPGRYARTPQRLVYCFDKNGKGTGILSSRATGEEICVGGAEGELKGDSLSIRDKPPLQPRACIGETITCQNSSSGMAECVSVFDTGGTSRLVFRRR